MAFLDRKLAGLTGWIFENWWYAEPARQPAAPTLYSKSGADGRIRTGDPLFTKQLLCQLSYVGVRTDYMRGLLPARRVLYEVATVVCAGSRGLTVTWLTGTLSLRNVVTKVFRLGSHQVIK